MRRFDHMADVEAFVAVIDKGSMTEGAIALSTTASVISRAISRLEARLGTQLIRRTTRRLSLTEAGASYLEQARIAFSVIDEAEAAIQGQSGEISGLVRLSAPTTYGQFRLPPMLARFAEAYPKVRVELSISNRNIDLVAEGFDLAIRRGQLRDSGLVARRLEDGILCLVASPDYIARNGMPETIADLVNHHCLPFVLPSTGREAAWLFRRDGKDVDFVPTGGMRVLDDMLGVVPLAESGLGICQTYDFVVSEQIKSGRLLQVLGHLAGRTSPFSMIFPPHRRLSSATRALVDFLAMDAGSRR